MDAVWETLGLRVTLLKRQKIILGIILNVKPNLKRTGLMKLAFLLKQETPIDSDPSFYDFVPYNYGPYSFTLDRDVIELARLGYISSNSLNINSALMEVTKHLISSLNFQTQDAITDTAKHYKHLSLENLLHYVYEHYPWYASRSKLSSSQEIKTKRREAIYTIGYEGVSIERFLCKLLNAGVEQLIDVRHNPFSRKFGFPGKRLAELCSKFEMAYIHIPELGIPSSYRKELEDFRDYKRLLATYERTLLPQADAARRRAGRLMKERPSALLCFEADIRYCHRKRLADAISSDTALPVIHL